MRGLKNLDRRQALTLVSAVLLLLFWIVAPLIAQSRYGFSAIHVSFGITVLYFVGYKLWNLFYREG